MGDGRATTRSLIACGGNDDYTTASSMIERAFQFMLIS
jgi:hypothetical protein